MLFICRLIISGRTKEERNWYLEEIDKWGGVDQFINVFIYQTTNTKNYLKMLLNNTLK